MKLIKTKVKTSSIDFPSPFAPGNDENYERRAMQKVFARVDFRSSVVPRAVSGMSHLLQVGDELVTAVQSSRVLEEEQFLWTSQSNLYLM